MSYTVFALKWRPRDFDEIIGQNHIVLTLKNAIQKNRLAHAYLFAGPRGVGKTSTARILAKASLDVIEIDGASNRGIDEIRLLRENVKFAPVSGNFKVYIIDEVHMLTTEAFNALLKTLEEPPEFVKFIFATTQPHKVLSTILSRCQRFDFRRISMLEITAQLERIVTAEKIGVDKEVLFAIAKSSDGSLRDAESVLDQLISFSQQKVSLKDVVSVLGLIEQEALFEITEKIIQKDAKATLVLLNTLIDEGKDTSVLSANLIEHFRNLMIAKVTKGDAKLIDLPAEICERLFKQSEAFSLEEIFSAFNTLITMQDMAKRLDSQRIPLEINLVRLAHNKKASANPIPPEKYSQKSDPAPIKEIPAEDKATIDKAKDEQGAPARKDPLPAISLDNMMEGGKNIISNLERIKMSVATYLNEGQPFRLQGDALTISFPKDYSLHKESLERKENKAIIEKSLAELFNTNLRVNFILSQDSKPRVDNGNNPFIKTALDMFGGRVIREE
ncbi:MAG: DNA polymerase III subunit gamma/tau [Candidatus Omnitrophica bacterium]|nr:DNA polymerase III subunit gamma/tau [Candidatus Omnitrophota bacterium]